MIVIRSVKLLHLLIALLVLPACTIGDLDDPTAKAKKITGLRKEGSAEFQKYLDSEFANLDALKHAEELLKEATAVGSNSCPSCFLEHAFYLSVLGHHYRFLREDLEEEAERADLRVEANGFLGEAQDYEDQMMEYFEDSNRDYRVFFRSSRVVDPVWYLRVAVHYQFMEQYDSALRYLDNFETSARNMLTESQKKEVERLRRQLQDKSHRRIEDPRRGDRQRRRDLERYRPRDRWQDD